MLHNIRLASYPPKEERFLSIHLSFQTECSHKKSPGCFQRGLVSGNKTYVLFVIQCVGNHIVATVW